MANETPILPGADIQPKASLEGDVKSPPTSTDETKVFISHAHADAKLVRRLESLLVRALRVNPASVFLSSREGGGVAPAAPVRQSIWDKLSAAPVLIVVVTPKSENSPWVWLEAGSRFSAPNRPNPLFVVPSARHQSFLRPVTDLKSLVLDQDDQLQELVRAVGQRLGIAPLPELDWKQERTDVVQTAERTYSPFNERRAAALTWLKRNVAAVLLLIAAPGVVFGWHMYRTETAARESAQDTLYNDQAIATAAQYLLLRGKVASNGEGVEGATITASRVRATDIAACRKPDCTSATTTAEGYYLIQLTDIGAGNGDDVVVRVVKSGYVSKDVSTRVDANPKFGPPEEKSVEITPAEQGAPR